MIDADHFRRIADPARAKALFKQSVGSVEIEIFSYCNRTCCFCPNSFVDRRSGNTLMSPPLYSRILDDLRSIEYAGIVWYSRYNEPTADRVFLKRLAEARRKLPHARLQTFTNGDYIDADYLAELRDAGLDELKIMAYLPEGAPASEAAYVTLMVQRLGRLGLPWRLLTTHTAQVEIDGIAVTYNWQDLAALGTNRGASLPTGGCADRQSPCMVPFTSVYIDYNGAVVPCCDIRSDVPAHADHVVARLTPEGSLFAAYADSRLVEWRRSLSRFGSKQAPCDSCTRGLMEPTEEHVAIFRQVARLADAVAAEELV